jgi:hypothetical protein
MAVLSLDFASTGGEYDLAFPVLVSHVRRIFRESAGEVAMDTAQWGIFASTSGPSFGV